jgi:CheY-like chemotaxis protein
MEQAARILGVDDSLTIRKALELVLEPAGYMLELAASGAEAVEKARGFQPAVVLLDFILPDMRGSEVCRRLAADPETAHIPVVLISAKGAEIRQAYHDASNVAAYVVKPFTPETIIETVAEVLRRPGGAAAGERAEELALLPPAETEEDGLDLFAEFEDEAEEIGDARRVSAATPPPAAVFGEDEPPAPEVEGEGWEEEGPAALPPAGFALGEERPASSLETAFEVLSAGLEGVYVEEVDTRGGAAADEAKSYTVLVSQLIGQLGEALGQVQRQASFVLCNDGSIRSLDEMLFDAYRRLCRVLFRASAAGALAHDAPRHRRRVLVACHRDSDLFPLLRSLGDEGDAWHTLLVSERFRQLPLITRLYGPTHLVVDLGGGGALWDQLRLVATMPERRRMRVLGVAPHPPAPAPRSELEAERERTIDAAVTLGPDLLERLRDHIVEAEKGAAAAHAMQDEAATPLAAG